VIIDEENHPEPLAVYVNWGTPEIARYIHHIDVVHQQKQVMVKEISENVYAWKVIAKSDGPGPIEFEITLGTKAFKASLEDGPEDWVHCPSL
jgi:hypothetical protein